MDNQIKKFLDDGYIDPIKILTNKECEEILEDQFIPKNKYTWSKSIHEKSRQVINLANNKKIIEILKKIIGNDVILWSSCFIKQKPKKEHTWHIDLEYRNWDGLTVWIGLKNLDKNTKLSLIKKSQLLEAFPQELQSKGVNINDDKEILKSARGFNNECELKNFYLNPGEMIIWSGKIWHKTINEGNKIRDSIILQYTTPNHKIKIPGDYNFKNMKWLDVRPPCLIVSGNDNYNKNLLLDASKIKFDNLIKKKFFKLKFQLSQFLRKFN